MPISNERSGRHTPGRRPDRAAGRAPGLSRASSSARATGRGLILFIALLCGAPAARADDTQTLPRGIGRIRLRPIYSFFTERWDQDGKAERVTHDLDGRRLDSEVFSDLSTLERLYTYRARSLSIGTSRVKSQVQLVILAFAAEYGITDRLTVGVVLPVIHGRHTLSQLELDPLQRCDEQECGMGLNPGDTNVSKEDSEYLPLDHDKDPTTKYLTPLNKEDVQNILVDDLGYQRLADWTTTGIGDIELGAKYRIYTSRYWATAAQVGLRLPTGKVQDINNLFSFGFGDGQTDLGVYWQNDFTPLPNLRLNLTLRYTAQLPDHQYKRVPTSADVPLTKEEDKEDVYRDLGDIFDLDLSASYTFKEVLTPFIGYSYAMKGEDDIRGNRGLTYQALMDETARQDHSLQVGLAFSTVPWVLKKRFSIPLSVTASYSRSLAGINNAPIANVVSLELAGYLKVL